MTYYAYVHAKPDGRIFYVGKGNTRRLKTIKRDNKYHTAIVTKYGSENILVGYLECSTEDIAYSLEKGLIKCFRRMGTQLTNTTSGGDGIRGYVWTEEARRNLSKATKGKPSPRKGVKLSDETKAKLAAKKYKRVENTITGEIFNSAKEASLLLGKNPRHVPYRISVGDSRWRYV